MDIADGDGSDGVTEFFQLWAHLLFGLGLLACTSAAVLGILGFNNTIQHPGWGTEIVWGMRIAFAGSMYLVFGSAFKMATGTMSFGAMIGSSIFGMVLMCLFYFWLELYGGGALPYLAVTCTAIPGTATLLAIMHTERERKAKHTPS